MPILNLARTMPMVRTILPPIEFCCWPNTCSTPARCVGTGSWRGANFREVLCFQHSPGWPNQSSARRTTAQPAVRCTLRLTDFVREARRTSIEYAGHVASGSPLRSASALGFLPWEGTYVTLHESLAREESMSFQVVRHEHPNIFVVNRQTYETYRFTVGDNVMLSLDGAPSDLSKARRTAIAFLAQNQTKIIRRR